MNSTFDTQRFYFIRLCSLLFMYFLATNVYSQNEYCVTESYEDNLAYYSENNLLPPDALNYNFCIKIYVHVIRKSDGTGGQSVANVNTALGYLAMDFNPHGIYFKWNGVIDYIDDTNKYYSPANGIFSINNHSDGVDIYLYGDDSGGALGVGTGAGSSSGVGTSVHSPSIWVSGYFLDNVSLIYPLVRSHVISHEMGHVLNLYHTHHGTWPEANDPNQCAELVNGINSTYCGDYVADTPADPNMGYNVDLTTCQWLGSGWDSNGDPYDPDELNIMAYTQPKYMDYFTTLQVRRMKTSLLLITDLQDVIYNYSTSGNPCNMRTLNVVQYPNPIDQYMTLDLRDNEEAEFSYQVYNEYGDVVLSGFLSNEVKSINTAALIEGHYFLHVSEGGIPVIKHIYIQH